MEAALAADLITVFFSIVGRASGQKIVKISVIPRHPVADWREKTTCAQRQDILKRRVLMGLDVRSRLLVSIMKPICLVKIDMQRNWRKTESIQV